MFLNNTQYSHSGIKVYEEMFGKQFMSVGGFQAQKVCISASKVFQHSQPCKTNP